jgi:hypothetical protein
LAPACDWGGRFPFTDGIADQHAGLGDSGFDRGRDRRDSVLAECNGKLGNWGSWAYIWTLIPGFVGVGIIVSGVLEGRTREALKDGSRAIIASLIMFAIFGSFLGGGQFSGLLWPIILIGAGLMILFSSFFRPR